MKSILFLLLFRQSLQIDSDVNLKYKPGPQWGPDQDQWSPESQVDELPPFVKPPGKPEVSWNPQSQWKPQPPAKPESQWKPQQGNRPEQQWKPQTEGKPQYGKPEQQWKPEPEKKPVPQWQPQPEGNAEDQWKPVTAEQWKPQSGGKPQYGKPEQQWKPEPQYPPGPEPKPECNKYIPKKARTIEISPIVSVESSDNSVYPCDSGSVFRQLSFVETAVSSVTCNGIIVQTSDGFYDAYLGKSSKLEKLNLTNYTQISTINNGNVDYTECGIITGGKCNGDMLWGVGIYAADDQEGCAGEGITASVGLVRRIEIRGKCQSRCSLGSSIAVIAIPVNNYGLTERSESGSEKDD